MGVFGNRYYRCDASSTATKTRFHCCGSGPGGHSIRGCCGGAGASAQTVGDVEARDQLIANQENLLNTYRCLFGVDTQVVPGGCPNPDTVTPGVSPENPTPQDIEVRDGLIQNQEALLNVYRCRFNVDTQIVPGGCIDGAPAPVVEVLPPLGPPPAELGFDPFYQKYLDASGIPIVTSAAVPDAAAVQDPRPNSTKCWPTGPDILEALANSGMHVTLIAEGSVITDIPEFSNLYEEFPGTDWDIAILGGGLGPTTFHSRDGRGGGKRPLPGKRPNISLTRDVMVHEIGHAVLTMAIDAQMGDTEFRSCASKLPTKPPSPPGFGSTPTPPPMRTSTGLRELWVGST